MVGSERALSEVDRLRLMVSVKVGRLPPLPETLSSTAMPRTLSQKGYAHDFDCDNFKYACSRDCASIQRTLALIEQVHCVALTQVSDRSETLKHCLSQSQGLRWPRQVRNANDSDSDNSKDRYRHPIQGTRAWRRLRAL